MTSLNMSPPTWGMQTKVVIDQWPKMKEMEIGWRKKITSLDCVIFRKINIFARLTISISGSAGIEIFTVLIGNI